MEEPDRGDALRGSQVFQIHQKCDGVKPQEVLGQSSEGPQVLHQLRTSKCPQEPSSRQSSVVNTSTTCHIYMRQQLEWQLKYSILDLVLGWVDSVIR